MFGGRSHILKGSVSLALVILILLVVILLVSEENRLSTSYLFDIKSQFSPSSSSSSVCNFAKGKWVKDRKRPLYSGFECNQWLSTMWACRIMGRPDFSFEGYRWQPQGCNMPHFDRFTFLTRMQNKTIAFIGDSLGRQQFQSLMCMASGGKDSPDVQNVGWEYGLVKAKGNHWVMHVNGTRVQGEYLKDIKNAKDFTIHSVVKWLDAELPLHPRLKAFFRTISPRHFKNGDWNTGGNCNNTVPLSRGGEITGDDGSIDTTVESAVNGTRIKILDITALSELRDEAHISGSKLKPRKPKKASSNVTTTPVINDCLHWCLPGIPDTWNELFIAQI
ncbi:PREDICTED: protein trichome birefringence-like 14 [Camelina sativa]|uniref:Protein trichome birefringence-like 14 n=1 Tax=Camelina sativa TaxID=90675 RepID=A0ABM0VUK2_CAMSA|nr:PREDICTED: protein trichome birefringence-like 14 [Camelina sativa]XP_010461314.1 PREDICTED: protein trichome birefringence-like 14 [Camelina sativa]